MSKLIDRLLCRLLVVGLIFLFVTPLSARETTDDEADKLSPFIFGVHMGLDIGAAVPWPVSRLSDGSYKFSAVPKLYPALGLSGTFIIDDHFSLSVEGTYKTVAIDAATWVENQRFTIDQATSTYQYFTGTADALMSFSMLEFPLYCKYTFNNGKHGIFVGGYYSRVFKGRFESIAKKGTLTEEPLSDDYSLTSGEIVNTPVSMVMDEYLGVWDAGWLIGYEHKLFKEISIGARFMMGLQDIFETKCLEYEMWHMRGSFVISWHPF